jgi:molecular chaperone GrpE
MSYLDSYSGGRARGRQTGGVLVDPVELQKLQHLATRLDQENKELRSELEQQAKELHQKTRALEIRDEALHKQSEHQNQLEAELLFVRAALAEAREKVAANSEDASWQERYLRLQADVDNLRKRLEQRSIAETAENRRQILADMLPLADHLDLALQHLPQTDDVQVRNFVDNIEATRRAFLETLRRYGIERVDPINEPFDPTYHEAIGVAPSERAPAEHVATVVQAGYRDGERVLRPARVLVSTGPAHSAKGE